jgi:hypothetical protein
MKKVVHCILFPHVKIQSKLEVGCTFCHQNQSYICIILLITPFKYVNILFCSDLVQAVPQTTTVEPTTLQQNPGNTKSRDPVIEHIIGDNLR